MKRLLGFICIFSFSIYAIRNPFSFGHQENNELVIIEAQQEDEANEVDSFWQFESCTTNTVVLKNAEGQVREISLAPS